MGNRTRVAAMNAGAMTNKKKIATLRNVSFTYPAGNIAIDKISLTLFEGEIVGMVGANGSGKTTLLKLLSGYATLGGGYIELGMVPIEEYSERMLNEFVIYVEQNPENQLTGPTVEDELARCCRMMGLRGRAIQTRVTGVLRDLNMEKSKEWFLDEISNGERRRVALGLALLGQPKLLLLDEPLADLDGEGVEATLQFLKTYRSRGVCIFMTSHEMGNLVSIADRIAVISKGKLVQMEEPEAVLRNQKALKEASVNLPAIPSLCMALEKAGMLDFEKVPLNLTKALEAIRSAAKVA